MVANVKARRNSDEIDYSVMIMLIIILAGSLFYLPLNMLFIKFIRYSHNGMCMPTVLDASTQTEPGMVQVLNRVTDTSVAGIGIQLDLARAVGIHAVDPQESEWIVPPCSPPDEDP